MRRFALLVLVPAVVLAVAPSAMAVKPVKSSASFTLDPVVVDDICSFPITVVSHIEGIETDFFDSSSGSLVRIALFTREQDTFTALGKSITGDEYTFKIQILFDEEGNPTHIYSSGVAAKIRFPDGTLFISAGRIDFAAHPGSVFLIAPDVGVTGDLDAFCAFFAEP
jgi:hypothetical protein